VAREIRWQPFGIPAGTWENVASEQSTQVVNLSLRRARGDSGPAPGSRLITTATGLLGLLAAGLFVVSLSAQYRYIWAEKHAAIPSVIEAVGLDVGMAIFSLLALGLAMAGQSARVERALIVACAAGSALMNYAAANGGSPRSVAAYVVPPVFLAVVVDRVVAVVRRHVLGGTERSAWAALGRAAGRVALYGLRFTLALPSTCSGLRRLVLSKTPLPAAVPAALDPISPAVVPVPGVELEELPEVAELPEAGEPARDHPARHRQDGESKTSRFLQLVQDRHGPLAAIDPAKVSRICADLAPEVGLNPGSARSALRPLVLAAQNGHSS
jgi:hypothetical protein